MASGTIWALSMAGYACLVLETERPSAIRRTVAFSEAVYSGESCVEGLRCRLAPDALSAAGLLAEGEPIMLVDPPAACLPQIQEGLGPWADFEYLALVDAIIAKKNLGTHPAMAPLVIALGPGFTAPKDCHFVIETMRGHGLGRIISEGSALPNTGVPGLIAGAAAERVLHADCYGNIVWAKEIGSMVEEGELLALIRTREGEERPVHASLSGLLRGMIPLGYPVCPGFKMADIDPRREEYQNCFIISDKARCLAGSVMTLLAGLSQYGSTERLREQFGDSRRQGFGASHKAGGSQSGLGSLKAGEGQDRQGGLKAGESQDRQKGLKAGESQSVRESRHAAPGSLGGAQ